MPWFSKLLLDSTASFLRLESERPYVVSLLLSQDEHKMLAAARWRNFMATREAETNQPEVPQGLPYHIVIDPSSVCNLKCPLCVQATHPNARPRMLLDTGLFAKLLESVQGHVIR